MRVKPRHFSTNESGELCLSVSVAVHDVEVRHQGRPRVAVLAQGGPGVDPVSNLANITQIQSEYYAAMRIKTHLDNTFYLSSLWSDLSCAAELVIADSKLVVVPGRVKT